MNHSSILILTNDDVDRGFDHLEAQELRPHHFIRRWGEIITSAKVIYQDNNGDKYIIKDRYDFS